MSIYVNWKKQSTPPLTAPTSSFPNTHHPCRGLVKILTNRHWRTFVSPAATGDWAKVESFAVGGEEGRSRERWRGELFFIFWAMSEAGLYERLGGGGGERRRERRLASLDVFRGLSILVSWVVNLSISGRLMFGWWLVEFVSLQALRSGIINMWSWFFEFLS